MGRDERVVVGSMGLSIELGVLDEMITTDAFNSGQADDEVSNSLESLQWDLELEQGLLLC